MAVSPLISLDLLKHKKKLNYFLGTPTLGVCRGNPSPMRRSSGCSGGDGETPRARDARLGCLLSIGGEIRLPLEYRNTEEMGTGRKWNWQEHQVLKCLSVHRSQAHAERKTDSLLFSWWFIPTLLDFHRQRASAWCSEQPQEAQRFGEYFFLWCQRIMYCRLSLLLQFDLHATTHH